MRLFIGYGYNPRDRWVEDLVFPLAKAFGCEVVHGRTIYGGALSDEVLKLIRSADAVLGFTTRREEQSPAQFSTHPWVVQELAAAHSQAPPIPFVEVREEGVVTPGGVVEAANAQRIEYREDRLAECLVEIAQAISRLRAMTRVTTIRIGPGHVVEQLRRLIDDRSFQCRVQTLHGFVESSWQVAPVLPISGSLYVKLRGLGEREFARVEISAGGRVWRSPYEPVDTVYIELSGEG